jgi:hypothetical protein
MQLECAPCIAKIFGLMIPFISNLSGIWQPLPMVVLGLTAILLSVLIFFCLSEITDRQLPQNNEEAIELHKRRK